VVLLRLKAGYKLDAPPESFLKNGGRLVGGGMKPKRDIDHQTFVFPTPSIAVGIAMILAAILTRFIQSPHSDEIFSAAQKSGRP